MPGPIRPGLWAAELGVAAVIGQSEGDADPTIFPPTSPAVAALCRGCSWEYSDEETDPSQLDSMEVATGPADLGGTQNPFTVTAIAEYERLLGLGYRIATAGSSDSHDAGYGTTGGSGRELLVCRARSGSSPDGARSSACAAGPGLQAPTARQRRIRRRPIPESPVHVLGPVVAGRLFR